VDLSDVEVEILLTLRQSAIAGREASFDELLTLSRLEHGDFVRVLSYLGKLELLWQARRHPLNDVTRTVGLTRAGCARAEAEHIAQAPAAPLGRRLRLAPVAEAANKADE